MERAFTSAIWKSPVAGPVLAGALGLAGDAVANTRSTAGVDQALSDVRRGALLRAGRRSSDGPMSPGGVRREPHGRRPRRGHGLHRRCARRSERCGFEVSQPRQPCATLARRHQIPDMIAIVRANGRSGWYLRVLVEGTVEAGQIDRGRRAPQPGVDRSAGPLPSCTARRREPAAAAASPGAGGSRKVADPARSRLTPIRSALPRRPLPAYTTPLTNHPPRRPHQARGDSDRRKVS